MSEWFLLKVFYSSIASICRGDDKCCHWRNCNRSIVRTNTLPIWNFHHLAIHNTKFHYLFSVVCRANKRCDLSAKFASTHSVKKSICKPSNKLAEKENKLYKRQRKSLTQLIQRHLIMDSHATTVVNCMLLALKTYPFKIYINDSNGVSAFNPIAELNLTSGPTILTAEYSIYGNAPTSASAR